MRRMATLAIHPRKGGSASLQWFSGLGFGLLLSYLYAYEYGYLAYSIPLLLSEMPMILFHV